MKRVYLDTSVFFKIFFDEFGKETVDRIILLANDKKIQVIISEWVVNEALAAIEKKVSKELIDNNDAHDTIVAIADYLEKCYESGVIISYEIKENEVLASRIIIQTLHTNASDSLHTHIAIMSNCDYFITADRELALQLSVLGEVLHPVDIHINSDIINFFKDVDPT